MKHIDWSDMCVDFDIAKELKKNGYPQEGNFAFFNMRQPDGEIILCHYGSKKYVVAFAPCSDELLKQLPKEYSQNELFIFTCKDDKTFIVGYKSNDMDYEGDIDISFEHKKLSDALGSLWLYVKKEGYIK